MSRPAPDEIEGFLVAEARMLDERRWEDWLALFAEDGWYWVPLEEGQDNPREVVSLIYDDRRLLETRIRRLAEAALHAQTPASRTSRIVANPTVEEEEGGEVTVRAKFQMVESRNDARRVFAGTTWHRLRRDGEGFRIRWKRVDLVDCDAVHDGISVPF
ncbi:MAG: aromatic-ring-hydroxylating dioxygenase subunit beta [Defluviicoccus sp.]|nr:aromatic-ring-hydroxylating dioxygenase subunit beta [Defluviicoccus sp.]MDE0386001.1 aromatic-ring-hydroxylating dioxygenase subunit beta [Defluviicoccus sp.]